MIISILKNIESINVTADVVKENKENLILLKERQLINTDKGKQNLRNSLLLCDIRLVMLERQNNF